MKRAFLIFIVFALAALAAYVLLQPKNNQPDESKDKPLTIGKNSNPFNMSFSRMMNSYYSLQEGFVDWDTLKINQTATSFLKSIDSLPFDQLKADSSIVLTAENFATSISSETKGLIGEISLEQKRRALNMLTDELFDLLRTVKFDQGIIYRIQCPMAFNDSSAGYWLSATNKIVNPYLGRKHPFYKAKMLGCGQVTDSIDYSKK